MSRQKRSLELVADSPCSLSPDARSRARNPPCEVALRVYRAEVPSAYATVGYCGGKLQTSTRLCCARRPWPRLASFANHRVSPVSPVCGD
eukprot:3085117-Pleurochrysis_carterae.AAC.3